MSMWLLYLAFAVLLFNSIYLLIMYTKVKKDMSKTIVEEIEKSPDEILMYPEVASIRGFTEESGKIKYDGIIYMSDKKVVFQHLTKKKRLEIELNDIQKISEAETYMGSARKDKRKVCILQIRGGGQIGLFVADNKLWEKKIKRAKKGKK
jgi:hypothetical protein